MKANEIKNYLGSENGKINANHFILALKENRLICCVKSVSSTGMSRNISVCSMNTINGCGQLFQHNWFLRCLGFRYNSKDCITVKGCGMDMIFETLSTACEILKENGFAIPENYSTLCCHYSLI